MVTNVLALTIYWFGYTVLHSVLASRWCKNAVRHRLGAGGARVYRLAYNVFSVISFLPVLLLLAVLPDQTLYLVPSPWRWFMVGGQFLALAGAAVALLQTDLWQFVGLAQLFAVPVASPLMVTGLYRWVRHPIYFFSLGLIWLTPVMSANLLTLNVLFTLYFFIGSIYEERRLVAEFGEVYRDYQRRVPRLIPRPWRVMNSTSDSE